MNRDIPAAVRRDLWVETFVSEECDDWDYGQSLVDALDGHLTAIEQILGVATVADPFRELFRVAMMVEGWDAMPWREALDKVGPIAWTVWEMGECFRELGLYGRYGVTGADIPVDEREDRIKALIARGEDFLKARGSDQAGNSSVQTVKIVRLAQARWALDTGVGEIEPASLAILGGWSEGRVRNMMSGADRVFENTGGRVPAASALSVLKDRPAFFDSLWAGIDYGSPAEEMKEMKDVLFVPVARDGVPFHSGLSRGGGYTIGIKGDEVTLKTFEDALAALHLMPEPAWRRPNLKGTWGLVKGVEWARMQRAEIERFARQPLHNKS